MADGVAPRHGATVVALAPAAAQHREIARSGMPEAIAKAMSSHMFNGPVQRSAAVCLFNLTFHGE